MKLYRNTTSYTARRRSRRGFTLVELIVVLMIIAILAAIGVSSIVGYIKKSRFDKNEQYAITIYQTAQNIVSQKVSNGTIEVWIKNIPGIELPSLSTENTQTDASAHCTVALTYNPKSSGNAEDKYIYEFLAPYFYDTLVFNGTLAVEFDISAINDNGVIVYSASVKSAFFSIENSVSSGWDPAYCVEDDTPTVDGLPVRTASFRFLTSHVGYFDGTEASAKPVNITPVYLPQSTTYELDGHIIAGSDAQGYLFNFRNGETLDVSWAIFDEDGKAHDFHKENIIISLFDIDSVSQTSASPTPIATISIDWSEGAPISYETLKTSSQETVTYEYINNMYTITRTTVEGTVSASVNGHELRFPITISKVVNDGRIGCPDPDIGYYEYTLSLDCMMERSYDSYFNNRDNYANRYGSERLFGRGDITPRNIYATISGSATTYSLNDAGQSSGSTLPIGGTTNEPVYAARAINDPVYLDRVENSRDGHITYVYTVRDHAAEFDGADSKNEEKTITGKCVVNTLFGDLRYGRSVTTSSGGATTTIYGSVWDNTRDVVITSYRHLYNIRNIGNATATFRIVRNLNWYYHIGNNYASEVKVFQPYSQGQAYRFRSPAVGGNLMTVSFPALGELKSGQTLMSMSVAGGTTYSINNVQLRKRSFLNSDGSYGLICKNSGVIYNIYTNNLNLVMIDFAGEGVGCDYDSIGNSSITSISKTNENINKPVGGLVGINQGLVGSSATNLAESSNTIVMNNTVVMAGNYWNCGGSKDVGGVIGKNNGRNSGSESTYGVIRLTGSFAVLGCKNVGGIIGYDEANIGARLVVVGSTGTSEFVFPELNFDGHRLTPSCIVASPYMVGGAIGKVDGAREFTYGVSGVSVTGPDNNGGLTFNRLNDDDYQISVVLPDDSLLLGLNIGTDGYVGGAIGHLVNGNGERLNIRIRNNGNIIAQGDKARNYGGAIGYFELSNNKHIRNIYVDVINSDGSSIGSFSVDSSKALRAGGAIGIINSTVDNSDVTFMINAVNDGCIVSYGQDTGAGGAIGAIEGSFVKSKFIISAINGENSQIVSIWNPGGNKSRGTGGAVGGIKDGDATKIYLSEDSIVYAENSGIISGSDYVGGTIGLVPANAGRVYAVNHNGSIIGRDYTGGAIGIQYKNQSGIIQSVLNGTTVSGRDYVGGATGDVNSQYGTIRSTLNGANISGSGSTGYVGGTSGRIQNFYENSLLKTIVDGNSSVNSAGSYVGGVVGYVKNADAGTNGTVELVGDSTVPVLNVSSQGDYVGGTIGQLESAFSISTIIRMPDQSPANGLVMRVSGKNNVGGSLGYINISDGTKVIDVDLLVVLHPQSYIKASGYNVGGAIGKINTSGGNYTGSITVKSIMGSVSEETSIIRGKYNVGGAVGLFNAVTYCEVNSGCLIKVDFVLSGWRISASGSDENSNSSVGGVVGEFRGFDNNNLGNSSVAIPVTAYLGSSSVTGAGNNVGGAIGKNHLRNSAINVTTTTGCVIEGANNVGGAIGLNELDVLGVSTQITGNVTGSGNNVGGVIGNNKALVNGAITATINGNINGAGDSIGGAIGYNNYGIGYAVTVNLTGGVSGNSNVGGVIGYNDSVDIALADSTATVISATINGSITGTGDNVGGGLGHIKNNTVTGVVSVTFQSSSTGTENNVTGNNNVGGIIGFNEGTTFSSGISSSIPAGCKVEGKGYVGGAIGNNQGILTSVQSTVDGLISGTAVTGCVSGAIGYNTRSISSVTSTINSNGKVQASGDNVGGAIGLNEAAVSTISVTSSGSITGEGRIGGAVGYNKGALEYITATINGAVTGAGTSGDVGGAIGYNEANIIGRQDSTGNVVAIAVVLNGSVTSLNSDGSARYDNVGGGIGHTKNNTISGNITVTLGSTARVEGNNNIGGLIGFNEGTSMSKTLTCMIPVNCMVRGYGSNGRVGGVIGYNNGSLVDVVSVINGSVRSVNGGYVGGAIGYHYNAKITGTIDVTISGTVSSATEDSSGATTVSYDYVGGAIGYCEDNNKAPKNTVNILKVKLEGNAVVEGKNYVGGVLGFTSCNIESVSSEVTGSSQIIGVNCVGGAIGLARAFVGQSGNDVFDGKATGRISNVSVTISADYALTGITCIGGAIGQTGDKIDADRYYSAVMMNVNCEINSRYLFDPVATGTDVGDMACAGGVIGRIGEGRVESITLSGTGGACNIDSDIFGSEYPYNGPVVSYPNTVLVAARGQSVGGIIGQVGMSEAINQSSAAQNVTISKIVVDGSINLCVISVNGADRIGGWIGCGLGSSGGFGNRSESDYSSSPATFDVDNVRLVYSQGSCVGGFCGFSRTWDNSRIPATYADVVVTLNDANIIGRASVGGALGYTYRSYFKRGQITVTLHGRTNIGDITGNAMPGDSHVYPSICYEAGGAIGRFDTSKSNFNVPIRVYFDGSLCRVWAGGGSSSQNAYGVGGVFGSIRNATHSFNADAQMIVKPVEPVSSSSADQMLVYSRYSNAGGVIGYIDNAALDRYSSAHPSYALNVLVQCDNDSGAAGGFVGRMTNMNGRTITRCFFTGSAGSVVGGGSSTIAGGFVGDMGSGSITNCYTTATVRNPSGSNTGGFAGRISAGSVSNCYVGGHTYSGAYLDSEGNISGYQNVGGFVGAVSGSATISDSYTTASVRGTGNNIGGFVGQSSGSCTIKNNYCTGLVIGNGSYVGAFAGYAYDVGKFTGTNRALYPVNTNRSLIGSSNDSGVIVWANSYSDINTAGTRYTAVPFDASLAGASFPYRAVLDNTHHGDWPVITNTGTRNLSSATIEFIDVDYDEEGRPVFVYDPAGLDLSNHVRVTYPGVTDPLTFGEDYILIYNQTADVGELSVVVAANPSKADNDYYGAKTANYIVTEASLATDAVVVSIEPGYDEEGNPLYFGYDAAGNLVPMSEDEGGYPAYVYTGAAIDPTVTVTYRVGDVEYTLTPNSDFYLSYDRSNIDISSDGYITVTITGYGNYKDNALTTLRFVIIGIDIADADVTLTGATAEDLVYDGNPKTPGVILRIGGQTRREGVDYKVEYRDNVNQGTASVVITGIGILRGTYIAPYEITTADNSWDVAPSIEGWTWDGTNVEITERCTAGIPHFGLPSDVHYEVYSDAACELRVPYDTITGAGDYYLKVYVEDGIVTTEDGIVTTEDEVEHLNYHRLEVILPFTVEPFNISVNEGVEVFITPDSYCVDGGRPVVPQSIVVIAPVGEPVPIIYDEDGTPGYEEDGDFVALPVGVTLYYKLAEELVPVIYDEDGTPGYDEDGTFVPIPSGATLYGYKPLVEDTDYSVNCINNTNVGNAVAVITGINNFAGVRRVNYTIRNPIVTFHWQNGDPETTEESSVLYNKPVTAPEVITRDGYRFIGWYTDSDCTDGNEYRFDTHVVTDIELYAKWIRQYTVTFVTATIEGATDVPSVNPITADEGTLIENPGEVEYVGYHIVGWYTAPDFSEASRVVYPFELDHDYRLYAKWELNTYTVTFDWQHAGAITTDTVNHGDAVSKPDDEDAPEYEGHGVYGWYIDPQCTTEYNFDTPVTSGITIYARWKSLWTVTFNTQGGSLPDPVTVFDGETIAEPDDPERTGYTFIGWYVDPECTNPFDFGSTIGKNYELYAKWEINKYSVTFISNGGSPVAPQTVEYNSTVSEPQEPTLEGYTFVGWYTDEGLTEEYNFATPVVDDVTLYAKWVHRITFVLGGGEPNIDIDVPHGGTAAAPQQDPSREGYRFTGWYEDPSCTKPFSFDVTIETNYTLYAGWEEE